MDCYSVLLHLQNFPCSVTAFYYADWEANPDERCPLQGLTFILDQILSSAGPKNKPSCAKMLLAKSSTEVEYKNLASV